MSARFDDLPAPSGPAAWTSWPVYWSAVWIGALTAICVALVIGLIGTAVGAQLFQTDSAVKHWSGFTWSVVVFSILGSFFAFVAGGWAAGKVAGILRSETAMLHGAIVWLVAVPLLLALATHGAANSFGGWYGGLSAPPATLTPSPGPATTNATRGESGNSIVVPDLDNDHAREARNAALGAVTALLLGLVGSVIGGWMASGEPMTFTYYRTRNGRLTSTEVTQQRM
jgi:hypothetical protein